MSRSFGRSGEPEGIFGFDNRFGLAYVDFKTQKTSGTEHFFPGRKTIGTGDGRLRGWRGAGALP